MTGATLKMMPSSLSGAPWASAADFLDRWDALKEERRPWDTRVEDVAKYIAPHYRGTTASDARRPDDHRTEYIFHSGPLTNLEQFISVMQSQLTPSQTVWFKVQATDPALQELEEVARYYDEVTRRVWNAIYRPSAGFVSNISLFFEGQGVTGLGALYTDRMDGELGIRHAFVHPADIWVAYNHEGRVNLVFRRLRLTAREALYQFKERTPARVLKQALDKNEWNKESVFLHVVLPNAEASSSRRDAEGMPWASFYLSVEDRAIIERGGYNTMPYTVTRYRRSSDKGGPIAPAYVALPDIRLLNEVTKTIIKAAQRKVDPPILTASEAADSIFSLIPGAKNVGALTDEGRALMQAMEFGEVTFIDEWVMRLESRIGRPLLADLFSFTLGNVNKDMTAREVARRDQELGMRIYPVVDGQAAEFAGPYVNRVIDLLNSMGMLPLMPAVMRRIADFKVIFDAPLARTLRMEEAAGYLEMDQYTANLDAQNPDPMHARSHFLNPDKALPEIMQLKGVPTRWIATAEEVAAKRAAIAEAQQAAAETDAAPGQAAVMNALTRASEGSPRALKS